MRPDAAVARAPDPDLDPRPDEPTPLLSIDWNTVSMTSDAEALAVWATIAPTGADWEAKLDEVPVEKARPLAMALLRQGNFTCVPPSPPTDCAGPPSDVPEPAPMATMSDPCLRRLLALWSLGALEHDEAPLVFDALKALAAIPPPESQLVSTAITFVPERDHAMRLELLTIAARAGQHAIANGLAGQLDEPHLIEAVTKHHLSGALEVLSAQANRAVYLAAITDEKLAAAARTSAISEIVAEDDALPADAKAALAKAAVAKDCEVAAAAGRALALRGDLRFLPDRARPRTEAQAMRALCVLASFERLQANDEDSMLGAFVPARGLELIRVAFDPLAEVDTDGDGDPRTERTLALVPRAELVLPEVDDMVRAFGRCKGTTCVTADREFRFGFKNMGGKMMLARIEIAERPPCPTR